jgi:hypothetical protein
MQCRDGKVKALARGREREREERERARERESERLCVYDRLGTDGVCLGAGRGREKRQREDALPPAAACRFS